MAVKMHFNSKEYYTGTYKISVGVVFDPTGNQCDEYAECALFILAIIESRSIFKENNLRSSKKIYRQKIVWHLRHA